MSRTVTLLAVLLLLLAACSSNEDSLVSGPSGPVVTPAPTVAGVATFVAPNFTFVLTENDHGTKYFFDPHTIDAPRGSKATIEIRNAGTVEHNLTIPSLHYDQDLAPGKSVTPTIILGSPSSVIGFYCKYHKALGMSGAFNLT